VENNNNNVMLYTEEQLMARLKFFIGVCLALTLTGIVFVVLYSLIFVTQPLNAISPIDQKFFELIVPIATFLTGTLSGIMLAGGDKDAQKMALEAATRPTPVSPAPSTPPSTGSTGGFGVPATGGFGSTPPAAVNSGFGSAPSTTFNAPSSWGTTPVAPAAFGASTGFGAAPAQVVTGFGGKPAPVQPPDPVL
jgi:hypothetical protein